MSNAIDNKYVSPYNRHKQRVTLTGKIDPPDREGGSVYPIPAFQLYFTYSMFIYGKRYGKN